MTTTLVSATVTGLEPSTLYYYRAVGTAGGAVYYGAGMTFTTMQSVPVNTNVTNVTVVTGVDTCFNATSNITIAGGGTTFVVQNGGSATMIAGEKILYLPGTVVEAGGYMLGYITQNGQYCGSTITAPLVSASVAEPDLPALQKPSFKIYPNPTTGSFTLEFPETDLPENLSAFICDIRGNKIHDIRRSGTNKQVISLENQPKGMYFIRVFSSKHSETAKILKH